MAGRHSTAPRRRRRPSQRRQVALVAALPVLLGGVLYSAEASLIDLGGCSESLDVSVAATQESVELLRDATEAMEADGTEADGYCVDYHRAAMQGDLTAKGKVVKFGGTLSVAEAQVLDSEGRLLASGRGVYMTAAPSK